MCLTLFHEKHIVENEYTNRLYKPFHFLIVVFGSVHTQGPSIERNVQLLPLLIARSSDSRVDWMASRYGCSVTRCAISS